MGRKGLEGRVVCGVWERRREEGKGEKERERKKRERKGKERISLYSNP